MSEGHRCHHRAIQNTLKFTAYPNKCAQSEIYIYVMSIALMLASNQETSDFRALILNNLNITSTKGSSNILGCKHFIKKSYSGRQSTQLKVNWRTKYKEIPQESDGNQTFNAARGLMAALLKSSTPARYHKALMIQPPIQYTTFFLRLWPRLS